MHHRLCLAAVCVVTVALTAAGCEPVGCDFREADDPEDRCQERRGFQAAPFPAACEALGATVKEGGCPAEGRVIGCVIDGGSDVVDFYYEPLSVADAEDKCGSDEVVDVDF